MISLLDRIEKVIDKQKEDGEINDINQAEIIASNEYIACMMELQNM